MDLIVALSIGFMIGCLAAWLVVKSAFDSYESPIDRKPTYRDKTPRPPGGEICKKCGTPVRNIQMAGVDHWHHVKPQLAKQIRGQHEAEPEGGY